MRKLLLLPFLLSCSAWSQCPGEDAEPALTVKTKAGPTLILCGFEDREVPNTKGKRAFSDFTIYFTSDKQPTAQKVFEAESSETYWTKAVKDKGIELEELWFFSEKPQSAFKLEVTCTAETCTTSAPKCILKMKPNPFPKALAEFQKKAAAGDLKEDGEDLLDQVFAQAFMGDKGAKEFYAKDPTGWDPALLEAFTANRKKLEQGCKK